MTHQIRVVVKQPKKDAVRLVVNTSDVFTTCGRTVIKLPSGFQIYPFGTEIKVYRA